MEEKVTGGLAIGIRYYVQYRNLPLNKGIGIFCIVKESCMKGHFAVVNIG